MRVIFSQQLASIDQRREHFWKKMPTSKAKPHGPRVHLVCQAFIHCARGGQVGQGAIWSRRAHGSGVGDVVGEDPSIFRTAACNVWALPVK